jgi:dCMP deaminase
MMRLKLFTGDDLMEKHFRGQAPPGGPAEECAVTDDRVDRRSGVQENTRPSWDDYFLGIAEAVAQRATCDRGRSGCVIVKDKQILVTGYVGSPSGLPHCDEVGHLLKTVQHEDGRITQHCMRTVHAEQNAICQAAKQGISIRGATLYCRMTPCRTCAMLLINCGIGRVVCERKYHAGEESEQMFRTAGVSLTFKHDEILKYTNQ